MQKPEEANHQSVGTAKPDEVRSSSRTAATSRDETKKLPRKISRDTAVLSSSKGPQS